MTDNRARRSWRILGASGVVALVVAGMPWASRFGAGASPAAVDELCSPTATLDQFGSSLLSKPIAAALADAPLTISVPVSATATEFVDPAGGPIAYDVTFELDLQTMAQTMLTDQVQPLMVTILEGLGFSPTQSELYATSSYVNLTIGNLDFAVPLPDGTTLHGTPSSTSTGGLDFAAASSGDSVTLSLVVPSAGFQVGAYLPAGGGATTSTTFPAFAPQSTTLHFTADTPSGLPAGSTVELHPGPMTLTLVFEAGIAYGEQLSGGAEGPYACDPGDPTQVLASTQVGVAPTTATTPPSTTSTITRSSAAVTPKFTG